MMFSEVTETISDKKKWKDFFISISKEELAELILDKMERDSDFSREIYT